MRRLLLLIALLLASAGMAGPQDDLTIDQRTSSLSSGASQISSLVNGHFQAWSGTGQVADEVMADLNVVASRAR